LVEEFAAFSWAKIQELQATSPMYSPVIKDRTSESEHLFLPEDISSFLIFCRRRKKPEFAKESHVLQTKASLADERPNSGRRQRSSFLLLRFRFSLQDSLTKAPSPQQKNPFFRNQFCVRRRICCGPYPPHKMEGVEKEGLAPQAPWSMRGNPAKLEQTAFHRWRICPPIRNQDTRRERKGRKPAETSGRRDHADDREPEREREIELQRA
jgi:hypothetical protein